MSGVLQVRPEAFYAEEVVRERLGLSESTLASARKSGALRYAKRGHRVLIRGDWLRAWLEADADREPEGQAVAAC